MICAKCKHMGPEQCNSGTRSPVCLRHPLPKVSDGIFCVTGKVIDSRYRDGTHRVWNSHRFCWEINSGSCPDYQPRIPWWSALYAWMVSREPEAER